MTGDRVVFFGTDAFSVPSLVDLLAAGWDVVAVVTKPDSRTGRGRELTVPAVKRLAEAKKIPVLQPARLSEITPDIRRLKPAAGIVVAYGKIIPQATLDLFPKGVINVHASLLPRYRGASPIESALLGGDEATGVTLMKLDSGMDTGPTYESASIQLTGSENRLELYEQLAELGADLLEANLGAILTGTVVPIPQDHKRATPTGLIQKSAGNIDWQKPVAQLEREIRAFLGWPGSRTMLSGADVTITAAHIAAHTGRPGTAFKTPAAELAVYAKDGSLVIDSLKPAGKREMTGAEFLAGHPL